MGADRGRGAGGAERVVDAFDLVAGVGAGRPLRRAEVSALADEVAELLDGGGVDEHERRRWEGALAALFVVLGR